MVCIYFRFHPASIASDPLCIQDPIRLFSFLVYWECWRYEPKDKYCNKKTCCLICAVTRKNAGSKWCCVCLLNTIDFLRFVLCFCLTGATVLFSPLWIRHTLPTHPPPRVPFLLMDRLCNRPASAKKRNKTKQKSSCRRLDATSPVRAHKDAVFDVAITGKHVCKCA